MKNIFKESSFNLLIMRKSWRFFLPACVGILTVFVLTFTVLIPQAKKTLTLKEKLSVDLSYLRKLEAKLGDLAGIDAVALEEKKDYSLVILPPRKDIFETVRVLGAVANQSQVHLTSVDFAPGDVASESTQVKRSTGKGYETLNLSAKMVGLPEMTMEFLENLERALPLINLRAFKVSNIGGLFQGQVVIDTFFSSLPNQLGKIDSPLPKVGRSEEEILGKVESYKVFPEEEIFMPSSFQGGRVNPFSL